MSEFRFMMGLASNPEMVRNVAVVGHLHHGKTALLDMLVHETHVIDVDADRQVKFSHLSSLPPLLAFSLIHKVRDSLVTLHRHFNPLSKTIHLFEIYPDLVGHPNE